MKNIQDVYPLSPMQQGLLFHSLYAPKSRAYLVQISCTLQGPFMISSFERALQAVVDRHPVLRSSFLWEGLKEPIQVVHREVKPPLEMYDWSGMSIHYQKEQVPDLIRADQAKGFDLNKAPLMRLTLVKLGENRYELIWAFHHLVLDGWSGTLLLKELSGFYDSFCTGGRLHLAPSLPYRDYIVWLRKQDLAAAEAFWRKTLKGFTAPNFLRMERPDWIPGTKEVDYAKESIEFVNEETTAIEEMAKKNRLTLNTLLQSAWAFLIGCYSGEEDVVFGAVVSGRPTSLKGAESIVGLFINTLPVRVRLSPKASVLSWLKELQSRQLELYQYEYSPLAEIEGWSEVPPGVHLFDSIMIFERYPTQAPPGGQATELKIESVRSFERTSFPLSVAIFPGSKLQIEIGYHSRRFEKTTIVRMLAHLKNLLKEIAARPDGRLSDLSPLPEDERTQMLSDWNDTVSDYPKDRCIHELFEAQAERTPEAVAVVFEGRHLTYRELDRRTNQLAHYLRKRGTGPEVLVGICMERSIEMVVAILGILKAGGAFLPLDPGYPKERLEFMLEESEVSIVLTQERIGEKLAIRRDGAICLDALWKEISKEETSSVKSGAGRNNLAYVMYTSGSTGKPKGVMIDHQGICNRLVWMQETYKLTERDRILQKTPFTFDVSVWEFLWPLMAGSRSVLARPGGHLDNNYLARLIVEQEVTVVHFVPSMLALFLEEDEARFCESLKHVICSGEALPIGLQERFFPRLNANLHNLYGPTETSIDVTFWKCRKKSNLTFVPIGGPISNTQIYILNAYLNPVPTGVIGELYVSGDGLARGYIKTAGLTAEKFIPNPFNEAPGKRLYRTGDLARWHPGGFVEFVGRSDSQVKVGGFRIELGEIEAVLRKNPSIRDAVVAAREDASGMKRLIAYLVAGDGALAGIGDLRTFLKKELPEQMVPSAFIYLDALPLGPNGKLNRKALPSPDVSQPVSEEGDAVPQTSIEKMLADIWSEVLEVKQIGIHDHFFELGGNSLIAIRLMFKIRKAFELEIPLNIFFESPTIAGLANTINFIKENGTLPASLPVDLELEAVLEPGICSPAPSRAEGSQPGRIFLTGGTGFLGVFLLHELLKQTESRIYCLVRAEGEAEGRSRLKDALAAYFLWDESFASRIIPISGDLAKPLLGLSEHDFERMAEEVEAIYHNGALVDFIAPYHSLKSANVSGTREVIRLASKTCLKPIHYISTLSVFDPSTVVADHVFREEEVPALPGERAGGYAATKWVAERMVIRGRERGIPTTIYRPGPITGHSKAGLWNKNDFIARIIKACIQMGKAPELDVLVDMVPVDYTSRAIVHLSKQEDSYGKVFHLTNPTPVHFAQVVDSIRSLGFPLGRSPFEQWKAELMQRAKASPADPLYPFVGRFEETPSEHFPIGPGPQFDCRNTLNGLAGSAISCPEIDRTLLARYFDYFIHNEFLALPQGGRAS